MKAVRMTSVGRPLELQELAPPKPGPDEVRVAVRAAGICHSDAHYRGGVSPMGVLPLTLGHEIAGVVESLGPGVTTLAAGDRVGLHYFVSCGRCDECRAGHEQFCERYAMLGHHRDGGFAELVTVPARNAVRLPDSIPFEQGAIMMCSSVTSLHALRKARLRLGETVAIFGSGGLGVSAIQLARALGARQVFAVDIRADPLAAARKLGATPIDASATDPVAAIRDHTRQRGVDVALDLVGLTTVMRQALQSLAPLGRAVLVGLSNRLLEIDPYRELIGREAELIGCNDHHLEEVIELLAMADAGALDLGAAVTRRVPLDAVAINQVLDQLERFEAGTRAVVVPGLS
jgi:D-arabinose 1-dehydrogenase-like Zn-dependent alcohol dehydrogenase